MNPWVILPALAALAILYVLLPVALTTFSRYRRQQNLKCPETGKEAGLYFDAGRAAVSACYGRPALSVQNCSLWPERSGCAQACRRLPEAEMREVHAAPAA